MATAVAAHSSGDAAEVDEVRRRFEGTAHTLADVGAVTRGLAKHVVDQLATALSVRGVLGAGHFAWSAPPPLPTAGGPVRQRGDGWLEAMIEQHLDLVVDVPAAPDIGERVLANLAPKVRALRAVGSLKSVRRLDDLAATLAATGYGADSSERGEVDQGWVSFLTARPRSLNHDEATAKARPFTCALGLVDGGQVTLRRLAWSTDLLEVEVTVPLHLAGLRWMASVFDDSGQLHLGQPGSRTSADVVVFALRPGLRDTVHTLSMRVTHDATRLEEQITL